MVRPVPEGFHTITPYLTVRGARELLDFVKRAFGAKELDSLSSGGIVKHALVRIGDSMLMLGECPPDWEPTRTALYLYVDDADALFRRAVEAGAEVVMEPADQFYGDRHGGVRDPFGNVWYPATHIEDVSAEEIARRAATMEKEAAERGQGESGES